MQIVRGLLFSMQKNSGWGLKRGSGRRDLAEILRQTTIQAGDAGSFISDIRNKYPVLCNVSQPVWHYITSENKIRD